MNKTSILVVEDDRPIRNLIVTTLKTHEYKCLTAENGTEAIMEASSHNPDIVLLDLGLPDIDGVEVIQKIRSWSNMPIIVISARSEDMDKIEALDAGADDYITKPFNPRELTIRARNLLNRTMVEEKETISTSQNIEQYHFNGWTLDINSRSLITPEGEENKLPRSEFRALLHFCENPGKIQTREDLLLKMTGRKLKPHDRTVDVTIRRIRKHFEDHPNTPEIIVTIHGEGYRFCGELE